MRSIRKAYQKLCKFKLPPAEGEHCNNIHKLSVLVFFFAAAFHFAQVCGLECLNFFLHEMPLDKKHFESLFGGEKE